MSDATMRLSAALAERYRVERELGAGGMATVYLAHDLKHERDVAIKVLHPELGAALGGERFLSEIRTTARLQHPHILPLLDSGSADGGLLYYVMPFVTGETLRSRLERERQLPIDDALRIAREVADALSHAHSLGVIHRDIKPENILLQGGHALVADFGIALAVQQAGGQRMTQTGLSLGTPQYMSPEQAMGEKHIDARSDIYALGAVCYEMLAGDPPFTGSSVHAIVAKVLTEKPAPLRTVRDTIPEGIERAILTALAKLPADRWATARELAEALDGSRHTMSAERGAPPERQDTAAGVGERHRSIAGMPIAARAALPWLVAAAFAVALAVLALRPSREADPFPFRMEIGSAAESRSGLAAGVSQTLAPRGSAVLSPDGRSVVYVGPSSSGAGTVLYLRRLDQLTSREIPGTANPASPVFSPDGRWIAFVAARRKVVKVPLEGGPPVALAEVADNGGIDWSPGGEIVIGPGVMEGLKGIGRVNAVSGGTPQPLTHVDHARKELSHEWPRALADGKTVLFTLWYGAPERSEIAAASLDDGKVAPLGVLGARALGVVDGQLVYVRADGMTMAVPFDAKRMRVTGTPTPVQDSIRIVNESGGDAAAALTHAGGLVFARGALNRRLVWVDRSGASRPALSEEREFAFVRISPNGRQVAVNVNTGPRSDLWVFDIATGTLTPLTSSGTARNAIWSADGKRLLFVSTQGGRSAFWWQPADGSGPATKVVDAPHNAWNIDLAPDGRTVVFNAIYDGSFNLESFALDSTNARHDLSASPTATEALGRVSPDGHSVAYMSDESGRPEIYVRSFPDGGGRIQISTGGGTRPVWSRDGNTLYYREESRMIAVALARDPALRAASRQTLFDGPYDREFDVSPDGSRFLMIETRSSGMSLVVIPNWLTELRRLTAAARGR